jgi:hypothetical protein
MRGILSRASEQPNDRVLFAKRHADGKWDVSLGWISDGLDAGGAKLNLAINDLQTITAVWANRVNGASQLVTRRHLSTQASLVDAPPPRRRLEGPLRVLAMPNPATGDVRFVWTGLPADAALTLYAPSGRRVARLRARGSEIRWQGLDDHGRMVPPAVYFYRLENSMGGALSQVGKLVWIP